jgi:hypothetical protein
MLSAAAEKYISKEFLFRRPEYPRRTSLLFASSFLSQPVSLLQALTHLASPLLHAAALPLYYLKST